ncbi:MAG: hypothetical protein MRJ92_11765 [Nitrospira sp.]|nr:hypothetical protein [Nitrospira sp.]
MLSRIGSVLKNYPDRSMWPATPTNVPIKGRLAKRFPTRNSSQARETVHARP